MIEAGHRAAVRTETLVSIAINALVPTAIIRAVGLAPPRALGGGEGLVQAMAKASGLATLLMTVAITLLVRARVRAGSVPALAHADLPAPLRLLPGALPLRAPAMALVAVVVLVPLGALAATLLSILPLDTGGFVGFNLAYGSLVGLTMTPAVVLRALADAGPA